MAAVRHYLENNKECRRIQLLDYFDPVLKEEIVSRDLLLCCDVCAQNYNI